MPLLPGQILNNRYRIVKLLGQGGFGAVYKAWDLNLERPKALKENLEISPEAQRQFKREAQILTDLIHPNLPRVMDHFIIPDQGQYLVMDFIEGEDLGEIMDRVSGSLPEAQALEWIRQICDALDYMHSQNPPVIHRDIKPANIKITPQGRAMLVDFGIAKIYDASHKTTIGARAVTPGYSPPEQYGHAPTDAQSDIYALGALAYHMLTGQAPPAAIDITAGLESPPPPVNAINPDVSSQTSQAVMHALQLDRSQRTTSVVEFKLALESGKQVVNITQPVSNISGVTTTALQTTTSPREITIENFQVLKCPAFHKSEVWCVAFSNNGSILASGYKDRTIRLWWVANGNQLLAIEEHEDGVTSLAFSPNDDILVSGSSDESVRLWQASDGVLLHTLSGHPGGVESVTFSPDGMTLASVGSDKVLRLWRVSDGSLLKTMRGIGENCVAYSPKGDLLATGGEDAKIYLNWTATGTSVVELKGHKSWISDLAFSADGSILASSSDDGTLRIWRVSDRTCIRTLVGHSGTVWCLAISPDGNILASGGDDKLVHIWRIADGSLLDSLEEHSDWVSSVTFSPNGTKLATGSVDRTVILWDID